VRLGIALPAAYAAPALLKLNKAAADDGDDVDDDVDDDDVDDDAPAPPPKTRGW